TSAPAATRSRTATRIPSTPFGSFAPPAPSPAGTAIAARDANQGGTRPARPRHGPYLDKALQENGETVARAHVADRRDPVLEFAHRVANAAHHVHRVAQRALPPSGSPAALAQQMGVDVYEAGN